MPPEQTGAGTEAGAASGTDHGDGGKPATWSEFVKEHPEAQALHDTETAGLRTALEKERTDRGTAEKKLRELAKTATDPETAKQLRDQADEMKAQADAAKQELEFITAAVKLGCRAPDKAYAVSKASGLTIEQMKADPDYSRAFFEAPKTPDAKGGRGTNGSKTQGFDMDSRLRGALGR